MKKAFSKTSLLLLFFIPLFAIAQQNTLDQIVDSSIFGGQPLNQLFNQIFYIGLVAAVLLAIVMIIRGGVEYMTIDAIASKENGKKRVQAALGGLVLAFSAILILNTINPGLTSLSVVFDEIKDINSVEFQGSYKDLSDQTYEVTPGANGSAQFQKINNPNQTNASADGTITVNGNSYPFRSGGGGRGYLPTGTYKVSNGRTRNDVSSMVVGGFGYSFDLSDAYDERVGGTRSLLRIHPDGGGPGTAGCIGIKGDRATQERFYSDLNTEMKKNGGSYSINVGK